jgi:hypothetical protein
MNAHRLPKLVLFAAGLLVAGVSWSQSATIQTAEANITGQADLAGIERYITTEMARLRIPGLALGVSADGRFPTPERLGE